MQGVVGRTVPDLDPDSARCEVWDTGTELGWSGLLFGRVLPSGCATCV